MNLDSNPNVRICLVSLNPERSGQLTSLLSLALELERSGYEVTVLTPLFYGRAKEFLQKRKEFLYRRIIFRSIYPLIKVIRKQKEFDVIQLHLPTPGFSLLADLFHLFMRKPFIVNFESCLIHFTPLLRKQIRIYPRFFLLRALLNNRFCARLTFKSADFYIVSSQFQKDELLSLGYPEEKVKIVRISEG